MRLAILEPKNRKWLIGVAAIGGLVILLILLSGRKRAPAGEGQVIVSGPSEGLIAEQARTGAMLAVQTQETQAALRAEEIRAQTEVFGIQASLQALMVQAQGEDRQGQREFEAQLATISASRDVSLAGISSQEQVARHQLQASVLREQIAADSSIRQQEILAGALVGAQVAQIEASRDVMLAQEQSRQMAIQRAKRKHVASIVGGQAGTSVGSSIAGVVGGIGRIFSDIRMKTNIRPTGERVDGLPAYSFEMIGSPGMIAGVMAQELELLAPQYVLHTRRGLTVDYYALDAAT